MAMLSIRSMGGWKPGLLQPGRLVLKEGRIAPNYHINDCLGNVRVVTDGSGTILEKNDCHGFGRWTITDPLAEKYMGLSPYAYCGNDPVMFIDPDGEKVVVYTETNKFGHTWVSVDSSLGVIVFTYGRYDGVFKDDKSPFHIMSNGKGVLVKLQGESA